MPDSNQSRHETEVTCSEFRRVSVLMSVADCIMGLAARFIFGPGKNEVWQEGIKRIL